MNSKLILGVLFTLAWALPASAMPEEKLRLVVSRGGEAIGGEEFLTVDESIVDYLATLPRPTQILKYFKYDCLGKTRGYQATLNGVGPNAPQGSVVVQMVYSLHDCKQVSE